jgi:hypothetical protein
MNVMPNLCTGLVTEHLVQLIAKQVDDKGLLVWYASEQAYLASWISSAN